MNLKDLNIEELPPNTIRIYSSDTEYKEFNSYREFLRNKGLNIIEHRTNGPSYLTNVDIQEPRVNLYVHYKINNKYINGRARLWFKNNELLNNNQYIEYYFNDSETGLKKEKEYFNFLKTQVFK